MTKNIGRKMHWTAPRSEADCANALLIGRPGVFWSIWLIVFAVILVRGRQPMTAASVAAIA
jgi:hypothetical protein